MTNRQDADTDEQHRAAKRAGRIWGAAITLGLASVVVVNVIVYALATEDPPALVREDYYAAALDHDRVWRAERRAADLNLALGAGADGMTLTGDTDAVRDLRLAFARPNDSDMDFATTANASAGALVPATAPGPGLWTVTLTGRDADGPVQLSTTLYVR